MGWIHILGFFNARAGSLALQGEAEMIVNARTAPMAAHAVSASPPAKAPAVVTPSPVESQPDIHCSISAEGRELSEAATFAQSHKSTNDRGRQLLLNQLYGGREPVLISGALGMRLENMGRSSYEFLTPQDLELLSDVYSYAQDQGVDLTYVDHIAADIGGYRRHKDGKGMISFNTGNNYDIRGWQVTVDFNERDGAIASRVRNGTAISSTRFDQGFLRYVLDPGFGALSHVGDFSLLEHLVNRFSAEPYTAIIDERFGTYIPPDMGSHHVIKTSTEVWMPPCRPNVTCENGVWRVTEKGRALGIVLESETRDRLPVELIKMNDSLMVFREWNETDIKSVRQGRLASLWEVLREQD